MTDVSRTSAVELATRIKQRDISPVEVLDTHLETIAVQNPKFTSIVTLAEGEARLAAKGSGAAVLNNETLEPLHGLPVVIKDVTLTAGIRTTYSSPLYNDFVPVERVAGVARLRRAGAILRSDQRQDRRAGRLADGRSSVLRAAPSRPVKPVQRRAPVGSPIFAG